MNDKVFLDTNILIYFFSETEPDKRSIAHSALNTYHCVTSIQALNEASNVWLKKYGWTGDKVRAHLDNIELVCDEILLVRRYAVNMALELKERYKYSYYDSIMLASALEAQCERILTEDMNHGQVIENSLKIVNPFQNE